MVVCQYDLFHVLPNAVRCQDGSIHIVGDVKGSIRLGPGGLGHPFIEDDASSAPGAGRGIGQCSVVFSNSTGRHPNKARTRRSWSAWKRPTRIWAAGYSSRGGTAVSMDARIGNLAQGDVLIGGSKIKEVATDLSAAARDGKATTLEARSSCRDS